MSADGIKHDNRDLASPLSDLPRERRAARPIELPSVKVGPSARCHRKRRIQVVCRRFSAEQRRKTGGDLGHFG
jgi:hypothetical protein